MTPITRRTNTLLATAVAALGIAAAGCGGGDDGGAKVATLGSGSTSAKPAKSDGAFATSGYSKEFDSQAEVQQAANVYAKCLRANGLPNYPDPGPGKYDFDIPDPWKNSGYGKNAPQVLKAAKACAKEFGVIAGPPDPKDNAKLQEKLTKQAKCIRGHKGFGDYPDPEVASNGDIIDHLGEDSPIWDRVGLRKAGADCGLKFGSAVK